MFDDCSKSVHGVESFVTAETVPDLSQAESTAAKSAEIFVIVLVAG